MFRIYVVALISIKYCVCDPKKCETIGPTLRCGEEVQNIPKATEFANSTIRFLDLRNCSKLIFTNGDFDGYGSLEEVQLSHINMSSQEKKVPLNKFSKLKLLRTLVFSHSELTDDEMWILPEKLQNYSVTGNKYTRLDVSMSPQIRTIHADNNQLENLPSLSDPLPPLAALYLKNNSMSNLTVEDLAPLCFLLVLKLDIPPDTFLSTKNGSCACKRLSKWISLFNITGSVLNCVDPPAEMECDLNCTDIKRLRRHCPDGLIVPNCPLENYPFSSHEPPSGKIINKPKTWNKTAFTAIFAFIGFGVLTALAFIVYNYNSYDEKDEFDENYQEGSMTDVEEAEEEQIE